jgi:hypothetical protein
MCEAIEDFDDLSKLGQGFTSVDPLEEVDIGDGTEPYKAAESTNRGEDELARGGKKRIVQNPVDGACRGPGLGSIRICDAGLQNICT